jgi:hypothetical protein
MQNERYTKKEKHRKTLWKRIWRKTIINLGTEYKKYVYKKRNRLE